jgi:hypothetical protein
MKDTTENITWKNIWKSTSREAKDHLGAVTRDVRKLSYIVNGFQDNSFPIIATVFILP